jgi:threonine dehydrogenase-like Zn-dependent dehydrogenase
MHIAKLIGPKKLVWEEEAIPAGQNWAQTIFSAISPGTEVAAYVGAAPLRPGPIYPRLVGYCNAARVVSGPREGEIIITHQSHRSGFACDGVDVLAIAQPEFAELSSLAYIFRLGKVALNKAGPVDGLKVGIIGLGAIGLGAVGMARHMGAKVIAFTNQQAIADRAARCGADEVMEKTTTANAELVDIVVSTSNSWADWDLALRICKPGATISVLGFPGRSEPPPVTNPLASQYFYDKQLRVLAAGITSFDPDVRLSGLKGDMQQIVDSIGLGALPAAELATFQVPSSDLESVYNRFLSREPGLVTGILKW